MQRRVVTRAIRATDWELARSLRCAALADAPEAFSARLEDEQALPDALWRDRAARHERGRDSIGFFAVMDEPVGLVVGILRTDSTPVAELVSLWVAPQARGVGAARALVEGVCTWAASRGCDRVELLVAPTNIAAKRLYRRCGFEGVERCSEASGCMSMVRRLPSELLRGLRRALPADAEAIAHLVSVAYGAAIPRLGRKPKPMMVDYSTAVEARDVWVVEHGPGLVAVLDLVHEDACVVIENIAVSPAQQRRGLGRLLLAFAEHRARERGTPRVRLYTNERFVENLALYRALGFVETHREPYRGTQLVHLRKELDLAWPAFL